MRNFETLTVGEISDELTFSGQNSFDIGKIAVNEDSSNDASFYDMGNIDLTFESLGATSHSYTSDNNNLVTLDYKATDSVTSAEVSDANFEFINSEEVTINVGEQYRRQKETII